MTVRPIRYIAYNPGQEIPASYNTGYPNAKGAYQFACQNARWWGGQVVCEFSDGNVEVVKDFRAD